MFSLHYVSDNTDTIDDIEDYSIYYNKDKKFLSFATIRINRTQQMICFSNFDNLSMDMRKALYKLIKESKDELDINHYKVSPFYSGYTSYVALYDTAYI
jgi:ADP-dependent phosphofructokinase/glucokinase